MRMLSVRCGLFAAAAIVLSSGTAFAAAPFGTLTCTGTSSNFTAQVSAYTIALQAPPVSSGSGGAGSGKITFSPANIHVSLSKFGELLPIVESGAPFQQCTLVTNAGNGPATYTFGLVAFTNVIAVANSGKNQTTAAYTDLELEYAALAVSIPNPTDDGGQDPKD